MAMLDKYDHAKCFCSTCLYLNTVLKTTNKKSPNSEALFRIYAVIVTHAVADIRNNLLFEHNLKVSISNGGYFTDVRESLQSVHSVKSNRSHLRRDFVSFLMSGHGLTGWSSGGVTNKPYKEKLINNR